MDGSLNTYQCFNCICTPLFRLPILSFRPSIHPSIYRSIHQTYIDLSIHPYVIYHVQVLHGHEEQDIQFSLPVVVLTGIDK